MKQAKLRGIESSRVNTQRGKGVEQQKGDEDRLETDREIKDEKKRCDVDRMWLG